MDIVWLIVFVLVFSNLLATGMVLALARWLAKLAYLRASLLGPVVLAIALFAAYATTRHVGDIAVAAAAGILGYFLKKYGFGIVTFLIGFVLGPILEHYLVLSLQIYGTNFIFERPLAMALVGILIAMIGWSLFKSRRRRSAAAA
jgi:TctA family transporter